MSATGRHFLFLQGPHGPFFARLARMLRLAGGQVWRVGFNAGDDFFGGTREFYIPFQGRPEAWPAKFDALCAKHGITDLVLYGDIRPHHAAAIARAKARGITVHVFEEGYLRPYWITYERGGVNGNSRLMELGLPEIAAAHRRPPGDEPPAPATWGDMREHIFYGALYHWFILFNNWRYPHYRGHRAAPLWREALNYSSRLLSLPLAALQRGLASARIRRSGHPFHLVLMQLAHDANFRAHGPFENAEDFIATVVDGFAKGAPPHHHLVFKAHPLEARSGEIQRLIRRHAKAAGLARRVHYVRGGKLARLLDHARSALTVNSTAGQQALWRGLPLKLFGQAVYGKEQLVSAQPLLSFFAAPAAPDLDSYRAYRKFLLSTSQLPGGYYARKGRNQLMRHLVDKMLDPADPYERQLNPAAPQHLRALP